MQMTVKQFVHAVHRAWENDPFLSIIAIHSIRCRMRDGVPGFYVRLADKSTVSVYIIEEESKIVFF